MMKNLLNRNYIANLKSYFIPGSDLNFLETQLRIRKPKGSEYIQNKERSEFMTISQALRALKGLKKDGYTLEQIITLLEYIANQTTDYKGKK